MFDENNNVSLTINYFTTSKKWVIKKLNSLLQTEHSYH
jgi:hypothetical protein